LYLQKPIIQKEGLVVKTNASTVPGNTVKQNNQKGKLINLKLLRFGL
jgi:hypothetical protein